MAANIDWKNAPEGATHYCTEVISYQWHKLEDGWWYFHGDSLGWVMYSSQRDLTETLKSFGLTEMPKTEDNTLDRHDALQWCLNNLHEFTALGIIGRGYPEGWTFTSDNGELLLCHTFHDPIKKVDFDMLTKPKAYIGDTPEQMRKGTTPWMPEVGEKCLLLNNQEYRVDYGGDAIGKEVILISVCRSSAGIKLAVIEHDGCCYCFRFDMLHPPLTPEEIEREEGIKALTELVDKCLSEFATAEDFAGMLLNAGYRKA